MNFRMRLPTIQFEEIMYWNRFIYKYSVDKDK